FLISPLGPTILDTVTLYLPTIAPFFDLLLPMSVCNSYFPDWSVVPLAPLNPSADWGWNVTVASASGFPPRVTVPDIGTGSGRFGGPTTFTEHRIINRVAKVHRRHPRRAQRWIIIFSRMQDLCINAKCLKQETESSLRITRQHASPTDGATRLSHQ